MAFAVTKVQAYGFESEEPVNKRYMQRLILNVTALAADVALDLGANQTGSLGTFWTAVSGTTLGANALRSIQDIVTRADTPLEPSISALAYSKGAVVGAGVYTIVVANKTPSIAFNAANGPLLYTVTLTWTLTPEAFPVEFAG